MTREEFDSTMKEKAIIKYPVTGWIVGNMEEAYKIGATAAYEVLNGEIENRFKKWCEDYDKLHKAIEVPHIPDDSNLHSILLDFIEHCDRDRAIREIQANQFRERNNLLLAIRIAICTTGEKDMAKYLTNAIAVQGHKP